MDREELSFYVRHHLTRQERLVIMLRYAEELEFTEIASILGIQPAEVEQIHAAIAGRLTEALAECELALA
jgi:DNA-directed RNA polymerase specialized sigma subunit